MIETLLAKGTSLQIPDFILVAIKYQKMYFLGFEDQPEYPPQNYCNPKHSHFS